MSYPHGMVKFAIHLAPTVVTSTLLFMPNASAYLLGERNERT